MKALRLLLPLSVLLAGLLFVGEPSRAVESAAQALTNEALIDELTQVSQPGIGFNAGGDYQCFIGVDQAPSLSAGLLGAAPPTVNPALRALVQEGVAALPALLAHLTDPRPTHLDVGTIEVMDFSQEYDPRYGVLSQEQFLLGMMPGEQPPAGALHKEPDSGPFGGELYTVRVGDLCFVAIGQIVDRALNAVRYQPSGITVINSPVFKPALAEEVRKDWTGLTPDGLRASLFADATSFTGDRRTDAVTRLCYYYPDVGIRLATALLTRPTYDDATVEGFIEKGLAQSLSFTGQDIEHVAQISTELRYPRTPVMRRFATILRQVGYSADDRDVLADKLNFLMAQPNLYGQSAFDGVALRPQTRTLLNQAPKGAERMYLNRLLIEDVFAGDVSRMKQAPQYTPARWQQAYRAFCGRYGNVYVTAVLVKLYSAIRTDEMDSYGAAPDDPDAPGRQQAFRALFPAFDPDTARFPDATDIIEQTGIINSTVAFPSQALDQAVDKILRSLSPAAGYDDDTDDCAVACITRLHNTKFARDCRLFYALRAPVLSADRADPSYRQYYTDLYTAAFAGRASD